MRRVFEFTKNNVATLARKDANYALAEDIGSGDLTASLIDPAQIATAKVISRDPAVICGQAWVDEVFHQCDPTAQVHWKVKDGDLVAKDDTLFEVFGHANSLLVAERTALNFLQLLSGVATKTAQYVALVQGTKARIVDTRKTLPGLRLAQKYAVHCAGGVNHRIGLFDAILIKENHIAAAGGIAQILEKTRDIQAEFIQIEVETLTDVERALASGATMILLDNMDIATIEKAVKISAGRAILEVSGGVNLTNLRALANTGIDRISIGALTKDVQAIDLSMRFFTS
jgi:nicotinate-nucleotide pyrophosphorylase (carboxylating)